MIIQCENCETKFMVSDYEIKDNGRFVRCSRCDHEWVAYPPKSNIDKKIEIFDDKTNVNPFSLNIKAEAQRKAELHAQSAVQSRTFASFFITMLCVLMIGLGMIIMGIVLLDKGGANIFSSTPIHNFMSTYLNHNLKITNIVLDVNHKKHNLCEMNIEAYIYNNGDREQKLSQLRVIVFDESKNEIKEVKISYNKFIKAGQQYIVRELINDIPAHAKYFSVDFGEPLELLLRAPFSLISEGDYE